MIEKVRHYVREERLLQPGERVAVACSGGADSVALLRVLAELSQDLGIVLSVAHFHHGIRGAEADHDQGFVSKLAAQLGLELHLGAGDAPAWARDHKLSLETAARELRHAWFARLIAEKKVDKMATAHTLDDQAETVLMRMVRGAGARGLAGIAPIHQEKSLVRPLLQVTRLEVEEYLKSLNQPWRDDLTNQDLAHTRNRVRRQLLPLLERDFNPAIRQTLADLAEMARGEEEFWNQERTRLLARLAQRGKPSRDGRSNTGEAGETWALDLAELRSLPTALQRQVLQAVAGEMGLGLEFRHIEELRNLAQHGKKAKPVCLPGAAVAACSFRELQLSRRAPAAAAQYEYALPLPGEITASALGSTFRARVISAGKQTVSGYNPALLLDRDRLQPELTLRNWRAGDRFFPAFTQSPKKVKELLQPGRLGRELSAAERKLWPVVESAGQIVWMRGFPVPEAFACHGGDAVLIEEIPMESGT
ncbi:MAG TPA: tRNA lysidine(34) synthetase TilS [Candidatus Angelobacter sp.]